MQESPRDTRTGGPGQGAAGAPWLAAYSRARFEYKLKRYCDEQGIESFLPMYPSWRRWSDRKKLLHLPLFPSYVFIRPDPAQRCRIVRAPGFLWFVKNRAGAVPVDASELEAIRKVLVNGLSFDTLPHAQLGDEVEVVKGTLRGCRGRLVRRDEGAIALSVTAVRVVIRVMLPDATWIRRTWQPEERTVALRNRVSVRPAFT